MPVCLFRKSLRLIWVAVVLFVLGGPSEAPGISTTAFATRQPVSVEPRESGESPEPIAAESSSQHRVFWVSIVYGGGVLLLSLLAISRFLRRK